MKKSILRFSLLLIAGGLFSLAPAHAQQAVPNGAMETWVVRSGSDAPGQWLTTDDVLRLQFSTFPASGTVVKSSDAHGGSFAAQLTNSATPLGPVPGFMLLGNSFGNVSNVDSLVQLGGLPFTARAARMQFYYKFAGTVTSSDDRPVVRIILTKTTGGIRRTVATGQRYLTAAATYTLVDFPLRYQLGSAPDSVHIAFGSADFDGGSFPAGNRLLIDDITLTGTVTATRDAQLQAAVSAYPNPSSTGLFTLGTSEAGLLSAPLTVTDALGRVVLRQATASASSGPTRTLDLRQQPAGIYTLLLDTARGQVVQKLVIQ
ncbi:MAG: T9SS type A sorting domain-containing protein [Bacteroidota bacterium]|nr:T9SS type A sorting domain-containing protein [Bacteroidota bacterium]